MRTASLAHYLGARYDLDLIAFRESGESGISESLPPGLFRDVFEVGLPVHSRVAAARAGRNLVRLIRRIPPLNDRFTGFEENVAAFLNGRRYKVALVEHFWCAPYQAQLAGCAACSILDLHNIESALHDRCASVERWPVSLLHRRFAQASLKLERTWIPRFSRVLVASESDARLLKRIVPESEPEVFPNTIPFAVQPARQEEDMIIFTANLEYHPNAVAVRFFREQVWPRLRQEWPALIWSLVGKNPRAVARYLKGDPRIRLIGPVENAVEYLAKAKVAVVPLLAGSGTRMKIIEAWAAGVPVVSTAIGSEGLPGRHGEHLLIADGAAAFARAISSLLASEELRRRLGSAGRTLYEQNFTWEIGWSRLEELGI